MDGRQSRRRLASPLLLALVPVLGLALALAAGAAATQQAVSGKLTITGSGTNWTLTFSNDASSTGPIRCWRYTFPPGVMAAGIGPPPQGWSVGGNKPPPAPILGGKSTVGLPPGGSAAFRIITDKPFVTSGPPGIAAISEDCATDGTAPVTFGPTGSSPPPPPKPKPIPCKCKRLTAELFGSSSSTEAIAGFGLTGELRLDWTMECTGGVGKCKGTLIASPSRAAALQGVKVGIKGDNDERLSCTGTCRGRAKGAETLSFYSKNEDFDRDNIGKRDARSVTIEIDRLCNGEKAPLIFTIVFKQRTGYLDRRRSDLNGNGIPDGLSRK